MNRRIRSTLAGVAVLTLLAAGCGSDDDSSTETGDAAETGQSASADVEVSDVWSRATAPTAETGAVYLTMVSEGEDHALIGASVDPSVAGTVELHNVVMEDGETEDGDMEDGETEDGDMEDGEMDEGHEMEGGMRMLQVDQIDLPAGETVTLEPGSYHIMLLELVEQLVAGDEFEVTVQFEKAGTQTLTAEVREV